MSKKPNYLKISNLKSKPKCMAPWTNLWAKIIPNGYVMKPCCVYDEEFHTDNIDEYLKSEQLKELAKTLESGEYARACWRCKNGDLEWMGFEKEIEKVRVKDKKDVKAVDYTSYTVDDLKTILDKDDDKFIQLDVRPGNLCNLKCRTCNASSSTEIAKESLEIQKDEKFIDNIKQMYKEADKKIDTGAIHVLTQPKTYFEKYTDYTYSQTEKHKQRLDNLFEYANLRRLKLLGGEPSIDPAIISTMQDLIDKGYSNHNHFRLQIVTNMTNINKTWKKYFEKLNVKLTASVDGAGETFEYLRFPAKWKSIEKNIKSLDSKTGRDDLSMNVVMSNILYLDFKKWLPVMNKLQREVGYILINFIEVDYPSHLSLDALPKKYKKKIIKDIEGMLKQKRKNEYVFKGQTRKVLMRAKVNITKTLFRPDNIHLLKAFFSIMMKQDKLRKQNIFDIQYTKEMYNEYVVDTKEKI